MTNVTTQFGSYTINASNTVEFIALERKHVRFNKLWIYPASAYTNPGVLSLNAAAVRIGERGDGPLVCTDVLNPTDYPMKIELPVGEQKKLEDVIIYGTAGDGVFFKYWPAA